MSREYFGLSFSLQVLSDNVRSYKWFVIVNIAFKALSVFYFKCFLNVFKVSNVTCSFQLQPSHDNANELK